MRVIFCDNLIDRKVDPDFREEYDAAIAAGFDVSLISFEDLNGNNVSKAVGRIRPSEEESKAIYRGWMLSEEKYKALFEALKSKNLLLINTPTQYATCHYLPNSYPFIKDVTPVTRWMEFAGAVDFEEVYALTAKFGKVPIIVKDFVKSQKHNWEEACFIPDASDNRSVKLVVSKFIELQGESLTRGLVFRRFEELEFLVNHSKSGMPLTREFRLFFCNGELLNVFEYWDDGDYGSQSPDLKSFIDLAKDVESNFFTMDIARRKDGAWIVIELGEGQVSGVPDHANKSSFYEKLQAIVRKT